MYTIGINGGLRLGYQDVSAVLMRDGKVVAAIEEERINRVKHSSGRLSQLSVQWLLEYEGIEMKDVDAIAAHGSTWGDAFGLTLHDYVKGNFGHCPELVRVHHHDAHAASAYYASGFDEAMILTVDNSGDGCSTQLSIGKGMEMKLVERISRPDSLGIYYSLLTQYCGFKRDSDEYKLMGLSSYGDRTRFDMDWLLKLENGRYRFNTDYIKPILPGQSQPTRQEIMFSEKLAEKLGQPHRLAGQPLTQFHKDLAAAGQQRLEEALIAIVTDFHQQTGLRKICLAGGVALNCVANQKLMNLPFIDDIYIQPAAGDSGISLGAAYLATVQAGIQAQAMDSVYLGSSYSNQEIEQTLQLCGIAYRTSDDPALEAAKKVADNQVVAWFQGRMEFGPRALGMRSILANPCTKGMQENVNRKIKFRESFRPFCPSVLEEDSPQFFEGKQEVAPYMTITYDVKEEVQSQIPAVTHVDGTARIQTVNAAQNPLYYRYLQALKNEIGVGMSLNTSFNRNNEPIVCSPRDAISAFFGSGMDSLILGNYIIEK